MEEGVQRANYTKAVEMRMSWLNWSQTTAKQVYPELPHSHILTTYKFMLEHGDTLCMTEHFSDLVSYAQETIPDDLEFDPSWLPCRSGFMWIMKPVAVPPIAEGQRLFQQEILSAKTMTISAISWMKIPDGLPENGILTSSDGEPLTPGTIYVCTYMDYALYGSVTGFGMWSFFTLLPGQKVLERIHKFENRARAGSEPEGAYLEDRAADMTHEIRWVYAALHLMSQKLTVIREARADRPTRRRLGKLNAPIPPLFKVVILRREEEARTREASGEHVDWNWQWLVRGHGRWQWYPSKKAHEWIWIDDFVKGPPDKPLKPPQHTIYRVER